MKNYHIVMLFVLFFSCNQKQEKMVPVSKSDTIITKKTNEENKQICDTIQMKYLDEKEIFVANGTIDSTNSKVYIKFENKELSKVNAKIIPTTGKGNIRFNQIIFPNGTSDGPFGMDLESSLKQAGTYILVIGHSQMADYPFIGDFKVQLELSKE